jgi:hypothetical protein
MIPESTLAPASNGSNSSTSHADCSLHEDVASAATATAATTTMEKEYPLSITSAMNSCTESVLQCSNDQLPIPHGLRYQPQYLSLQEQNRLWEDLQGREFAWEGFDRRRRVQRYLLNNANDESIDDNHNSNNMRVPSLLLALATRIEQDTNLKPSHVSVEEYNVPAYSQQRISGSVFEHSPVASEDEDKSHCYFVAYIPLGKAAMQHINKPIRRQASCWQLESPNHISDIWMEPGSLLAKSGEALWNWRYHLEASSSNSDPVLLLKFYSLPTTSDTEITNGSISVNIDNFGYMHSESDDVPRGDMPPMKDIMTIIITTSPIKSNPSTEVLEKTLETFQNAGPDFCACSKIIVCDGYRTQTGQGDVSRKHTNAKQAMRNGIVTDEQAENYRIYKERLHKLCAAAVGSSTLSAFANTTVHELDSRQGYGFALRHALRHYITTPYVCVIQHDRTFMRPTPMKEALEAMWHHRNIKFIGLSMRSNINYRDIFLGKYGRKYLEELKEMILRVPELLVDATEYGPNSHSTRNMTYGSDKLRGSITAIAESYQASLQNIIEQEYREKHPVPPGKHQISLTPTLFWYDNVHICETEHYRDFIFNPLYKMVAKGGFVEDKCSPVMKRTVERLGLTDGHSRFGCYILDDHSGLFFTGHLDGGAYLTELAKEEFR